MDHHSNYDFLSFGNGIEALMRAIKRARAKGSDSVSVLDVGAGSGDFLAQAYTLCKAEGIGNPFLRGMTGGEEVPVSNDLQVCKLSGINTIDRKDHPALLLQRCCLERLSFATLAEALIGRSFDLIVSSWTFRHLADPLSLIESLILVLEPDGEILINEVWVPFENESGSWDDPAAMRKGLSALAANLKSPENMMPANIELEMVQENCTREETIDEGGEARGSIGYRTAMKCTRLPIKAAAKDSAAGVRIFNFGDIVTYTGEVSGAVCGDSLRGITCAALSGGACYGMARYRVVNRSLKREGEDFDAQIPAPDTPTRFAVARDALFAENAVAGAHNSYGVLGRRDYDCGKEWSVLSFVRSLGSDAERQALRVCDIGTGNGDILAALHKSEAITWKQLLGITAEDLRSDQQEKQIPDESYAVMNIEKPPEGFLRRHCGQWDLVISDMTFIWLSDPMLALKHAHTMLSKDGMMILGAVPFNLWPATLGPEEEQKKLSAVVKELQSQGHKIAIAKDSAMPCLSWIVLKKKLEEDKPLDFCGLFEPCGISNEHKVLYRCNLESPADGTLHSTVKEAIGSLSLPAAENNVNNLPRGL